MPLINLVVALTFAIFQLCFGSLMQQLQKHHRRVQGSTQIVRGYISETLRIFIGTQQFFLNLLPGRDVLCGQQDEGGRVSVALQSAGTQRHRPHPKRGEIAPHLKILDHALLGQHLFEQ